MIIGKFEDHLKIRHKEIMVCTGYFILAFAVLGLAFVKNVYHLYVVQGLLGIGVAIAGPSWNALYTKMIDHGREASEWAYWDGGTRIALAVSAIAGGFLVKIYGFKTLFGLMFMINLCAALFSLKLLGRGKKYKR